MLASSLSTLVPNSRDWHEKQAEIFISKNQALQMLYLKHHVNKTSQVIIDKKVTKSTKIWSPRNKQIYLTVQTVTDNTLKHKCTL